MASQRMASKRMASKRMAARKVASCARNINSGTAIRNYDFWMISNDQAGPSPFFTNLASIEFSERDGSAMCSMVDSCQDGNCVGTSRYLPLTPEQFAACEADVSMAAADRGLNCIDM